MFFGGENFLDHDIGHAATSGHFQMLAQTAAIGGGIAQAIDMIDPHPINQPARERSRIRPWVKVKTVSSSTRTPARSLIAKNRRQLSRSLVARQWINR
jgi:hypothetical protein